MRNNMGNKVYQVKGNDELPHWVFELANKGITFTPLEDGMTMTKVGMQLHVPIGDCIVHSSNDLVYTCTKEHADLEGWSY